MWWSTATALAGLPSIDEPVRSGDQAPTDAAVVIGVEDYAFIADVPFASRDARAFYDLLLYTRGIPAERLHLLQGGGREQILGAVKAAGEQVGAGGTVWVYFAGHGAAAVADGQRLLLGDDVRSDPALFEARAVPVAEVERLARSGGGEVLLVLDTCYAGAGRGGEELFAGKRFAVPTYALSTSGTSTWTAAQPNELSGPLPGAQHGAFTYLVVGAMRGWADGELDGRRDGAVTGAEAKAYVSRTMAAVQQRSQTPVWTGSDAFVLTKGAIEAPPELAAAAGGTADPGASIVGVSSEDALAALLASKGSRAEAEAAVRADAKATWSAVYGMAQGGGEAGRLAVQGFVDRYSAVKIDTGGVATEVEVPEVAMAESWVSSWDYTDPEQRSAYADIETWTSSQARLSKRSSRASVATVLFDVGGVGRAVIDESTAASGNNLLSGGGSAFVELDLMFDNDLVVGAMWLPGSETEGFRHWTDLHAGVGEDGVMLVLGGGLGLGGPAPGGSSAVYGVQESVQLGFYTEEEFHLFAKFRLEQRQLFGDELLHATALGFALGFGFGEFD